ncbi:MAG: discoidin domain-containing protein, partial [Lentisphaeria bacterium]|nr:discoidin domain-containing protein [Lentisphaeria bacterium]
MKTTLITALLVAMFAVHAAEPTVSLDAAPFTTHSLPQVLQTTRDLGLSALVAHDQLRISPENQAPRFTPALDKAQRQALKAALKAAGVVLAAGQFTAPADAQGWAELAQFAADLGIPRVISTPAAANVATAAAACAARKITLVLPYTTLPAAATGLDALATAVAALPAGVGMCLDLVACRQAGLDPAIVLATLGRRVVVIRLNDADTASGKGLPLAGTDDSSVQRLFQSMRLQNWSGLLSITHDQPDYSAIRQSVLFANLCLKTPADQIAGLRAPIMTTDIADTWALLDTQNPGHWPKPKVVDTSMYRNAITGDNAVATAASPGFNDRESPAKAFDQDAKTKYCTPSPTPWLQLQFTQALPAPVAAYAITSANDAPSRDPRQWQLLASSDGDAWTTIDSQRDVAWFGRHEKALFVLKKPAAGPFFRLLIEANSGDKSFQIAEL